MPRPLLVKIDIAAVCGKATYQRGHSYWQSGRVLEVGWDAFERGTAETVFCDKVMAPYREPR